MPKNIAGRSKHENTNLVHHQIRELQNNRRMVNLGFTRKEMFWDTNYDELDQRLNRSLIIQRVIDYGTWEEFNKMLDFYGLETVTKEAKANRELSDHAMYFLSHYLGEKIDDFICYTRRQSSPVRFHF